MKVLVTGGGGFLGEALVRLLLQQGYQVRSFSRGHYPRLEKLGVELMRGDLTRAGEVQRACAGCARVYHVAAKAGIWGKREDFFSTNVAGTRNVIRACLQEGITQLVYCSSPSVVFDGKDMEGADEGVPYPRFYKADYPASKAVAERLVLAANSPRLATVALRPHLIWGPGDPHLVPGILKRARRGRLRRVGRENKRVDLTYVDNAAWAHVLAGERLRPGAPIAGRTYFISQDQPIPLWDFVDRVLQAAGLPPVRKRIPVALAYGAGALCERIYSLMGWEEDPPMTRFLAEELATAHWFNISAARRDLDYQPLVHLEEGFRRLARWLQQGEEFKGHGSQGRRSPLR